MDPWGEHWTSPSPPPQPRWGADHPVDPRLERRSPPRVLRAPPRDPRVRPSQQQHNPQHNPSQHHHDSEQQRHHHHQQQQHYDSHHNHHHYHQEQQHDQFRHHHSAEPAAFPPQPSGKWRPPLSSEPGFRDWVLRKKLVPVDEFRRIRKLKGKLEVSELSSVEGYVVPVPVALEPGETEHEYEQKLRAWLRGRKVVIEDLRDDPLRERVFRTAYANTRLHVNYQQQHYQQQHQHQHQQASERASVEKSSWAADTDGGTEENRGLYWYAHDKRGGDTHTNKKRSGSLDSDRSHDQQQPPHKVRVTSPLAHGGRDHSRGTVAAASYAPIAATSSPRPSAALPKMPPPSSPKPPLTTANSSATEGITPTRCRALIPKAGAPLRSFVAAYIKCYCVKCLRDWNLKLTERLEQMEEEMSELKKRVPPVDAVSSMGPAVVVVSSEKEVPGTAEEKRTTTASRSSDVLSSASPVSAAAAAAAAANAMTAATEAVPAGAPVTAAAAAAESPSDRNESSAVSAKTLAVAGSEKKNRAPDPASNVEVAATQSPTSRVRSEATVAPPPPSPAAPALRSLSQSGGESDSKVTTRAATEAIPSNGAMPTATSGSVQALEHTTPATLSEQPPQPVRSDARTNAVVTAPEIPADRSSAEQGVARDTEIGEVAAKLSDTTPSPLTSPSTPTVESRSCDARSTPTARKPPAQGTSSTWSEDPSLSDQVTDTGTPRSAAPATASIATTSSTTSTAGSNASVSPIGSAPTAPASVVDAAVLSPAAPVSEPASVKAQMTAEYDALNRRILLNEKVLQSAVEQLQQRMLTDMAGAFREQEQIRVLRESIVDETVNRDAAVAMVVTHCWFDRRAELEAQMAQLGSLDILHVQRVCHVKCAELAGRIEAKKLEVSALRGELAHCDPVALRETAEAAASSGATLSIAAARESGSHEFAEGIKIRIAELESAIGGLEQEQAAQFMRLFQFSSRIRSMCEQILECGATLESL